MRNNCTDSDKGRHITIWKRPMREKQLYRFRQRPAHYYMEEAHVWETIVQIQTKGGTLQYGRGPCVRNNCTDSDKGRHITIWKRPMHEKQLYRFRQKAAHYYMEEAHA